MFPSTLTPDGIIDATRSYFDSLGSLTNIVVGFLGGTYSLGKFPRIGFDAYGLGISSCTCIDAFLVRGFFVYEVDAPTFGGAMDLRNLALSTTHLNLCSLRMSKQL
jgi:hypothetical protein